MGMRSVDRSLMPEALYPRGGSFDALLWKRLAAPIQTDDVMRTTQDLEDILNRIDGRGYKAYADIRGSWDAGDFVLHVDHVQGDPFAAPSRVRVNVPLEVARLPPGTWCTRPRRLGVAAFLQRTFVRAARAETSGPTGQVPGGRRGSGRSGEIRMEDPGQTVLPHTAVTVGADGAIEARFTVGLPASGRRVRGSQARSLLLETVPSLVESALMGGSYSEQSLDSRAAVNEDAEALRAVVEENGCVSFIADGAVLPRRSGVDDRPLADDSVVSFSAPDGLRATVSLPNAGSISGMFIPSGITLVVGGGFHGKSTLLRAIEAGVYNHCPGDGRERVATRHGAVKVRAEDGRSVSGVDISPFIGELPFLRETRAFTTPNASGSTSQASGIMECLEMGADALLIDEDTAATNFMIRDRRMQTLVPKEGEPITPFIDRVESLHRQLGISSVLVIGGSGDYLDVADTVIRMRDYRPEDVTDEARRVAESVPTGRVRETSGPMRRPSSRTVRAGSLDARKGRRERNVRVLDEGTLGFGTETIDMSGVSQIASRAQLRAIGQALALLSDQGSDADLGIAQSMDRIEAIIQDGGLDALDPRLPGDLAGFRRFELAAALNRLRSIRVV